MAVTRLERLYQDLCASPTPTRSRSLLGWLQKPKSRDPIQGLYMWGGVGRGKTWLMDTFFDSLPGERKLRVHFHRFMHRVHDELKGLTGQADPLKLIASKLASEASRPRISIATACSGRASCLPSPSSSAIAKF